MPFFAIPNRPTTVPAAPVNLDVCHYVRPLDDPMQKPAIGFYFGLILDGVESPSVTWVYETIEQRDRDLDWISRTS